MGGRVKGTDVVVSVQYSGFVCQPAGRFDREQVKYVNSNVWSMVVQTEDLSRDALMEELKNATEIAIELSEY